MRALLALWLLFVCGFCESAALTVRVFDREGRPVQGVVVTVDESATNRASPGTAVMDQLEQRFVPFVLPVRTGTAVIFPNSDSVAHQVYSFSPTKRFELGLYRGRPHPPVVFDTPGVVVLGCNIHDKMIGYVYVTDADVFGTTNRDGEWRSGALPEGDVRVEVWSPLFARDEPPVREHIKASTSAEPNQIVVHLKKALRAEPRGQSDPKIRDY